MGGSGEEAQQIDKVAGLADDPAAANGQVLGPVIGRDGARIHRHRKGLRSGDAREQLLHLLHVRCKPPVKANIAIPQRQRLLQLAAHRLHRRHQTIGPHLLSHLLDLVRLLAGLLERIGLAKVHQHALGPGRDQRACSADQQRAAADTRTGDFGQLGAAVFQILVDLFHGVPSAMTNPLTQMAMRVQSTVQDTYNLDTTLGQTIKNEMTGDWQTSQFRQEVVTLNTNQWKLRQCPELLLQSVEILPRLRFAPGLLAKAVNFRQVISRCGRDDQRMPTHAGRSSWMASNSRSKLRLESTAMPSPRSSC